tara:strand:+ start:154 stop:321 length:168 start_codon:yes stop_codon:yes gene_type:complete
MTKKGPYIEARMYLEGLIVILESLEGREDPLMNISILTDVEKKIGDLRSSLESYN